MNNENEDLTKEELEIQKLQDRIKNLKEKQKRNRQKEKERLRKERTKRLIEVGGLTEKMLDVTGTENVRTEIEELLKIKKYLQQLGIENVTELHNRIT